MDKNICIISNYFLESTLPLAKNISEYNRTDLIILITRGNTNAFIFKISPKTKLGFLEKTETFRLLNKFLDYLKSLNNIKILILTGRSLKHPVDTVLILYLCIYLWLKNYSIIHIIGQNPRLALIHFFFRKKTIQTFHEFASHSLLERNRNYEKCLSRYPKKFIFHSQYVREGFIEKKNQMVEVIPFSLFETYNFTMREECYEIGKNAVTVIGIIRPYKGIQLFIDAVTILLDNEIEITPVIAGRGELNQYSFKFKDHYFIVNQALSDSQFCEIIKKSSIVVCPYLSASQSGIPMVAYLFNKPVVATNVGALPEYISDKRLLVDINAEHLAATIQKLLTDTSFYNDVVSIQNETYLNTKTWKKIAQKTIHFYNSSNQD